ncbi:MAG: cytochrome c peroxidase [Reichenbachiella sp.]|uniref:cytochrome-c peroxidase n=1 Tax=Reichenbachiella sp. TaxID=2184521 RepID=UPI0032989674
MKIRLLIGWMGLMLLAACADDTTIKSPTPYLFEPPVLFGDGLDIPNDNPFTEEGIALGRNLFYEKMLSRNNQISCGTCHQQSKAFTDGAAFSTGLDGALTSKSSMSLVNLHWQSKFFWDGRALSLEAQALQPIQDHIEMDLPIEEAVSRLTESNTYRKQFAAAFETEEISGDLIAKALSQFMRTLVSSNSRYDQHLLGENVLTDQEKLGMDLFFTHPVANTGLRGGNCGDCHKTILTSGDRKDFLGFNNNGLDADDNLEDGLMATTGKPEDKGKFKAPSLRNIALTAPYMHDGRFATLEEVLDHYNHQVQTSATLDRQIVEATNLPEAVLPVKLGLSEEEKEAIIAFLHTLTDETFITNEDFSDPFEN